jgi:hypothetical protein
MNRIMRWTSCLAAALACGCSTGDDSKNNFLIPDRTLNISQSLMIPAEGIVAGAIIYLIVDPLAPNWQIEQSQLDGDRYRIALTKKRFTTGGDGEAAPVFYRRAEQIARANGGAKYRVLEFTEGIESTVPIARRVAQGIIEVVR